MSRKKTKEELLSDQRLRGYCKKQYNITLREYRSNPTKYPLKEKKIPLTKKEKTHKDNLKRFFNITPIEYKHLLEKQNYVCAICEKAEFDTYKGIVRRLAVDHNHETGEVRALLCSQCNRGLGMFKDSPSLLIKAYNYLNKFGSYGI